MAKLRDKALIEALADGTPLTSWPLLARVARWMSEHGVDTVSELWAVDPVTLVQQRGFGPRSVADTDRLVRGRFGLSWQELHSVAASLQTRPKPLTRRVERRLDTPVEDLALPSRLMTWARKVGVKSVRDLAVMDPERLAAARGIGETTLETTRRLLEEAVGMSWEEIRFALGYRGDLALAVKLERERQEGLLARRRDERYGGGLRAALAEACKSLSERERDILLRRLGLRSGDCEWLQDIGDDYGLTRERVRQLERAAWRKVGCAEGFVEYVRDRCEQVAPEGLVDLEDLRHDAWWSELWESPASLDSLFERLLEGDWRIVGFNERWLLTALRQDELDASWEATWEVLREVELPQNVAAVQRAVHRRLAGATRKLRTLMWAEAEKELLCQGRGQSAEVVALRATRTGRILQYLAAQDGPVPVTEVYAAVGRVSNMPADVFYFAMGLVGLERHFPHYRRWQRRLVPLVIEQIEKHGPERQWRTVELVELVKEKQKLPDWLDSWHLGEILRRADGVDYRGRGRVTLPRTSSSKGRRYLREAVEAVLESARRPLDRGNLEALLRGELAYTSVALATVLARETFVEVAQDVWGLRERDMPGGIAAGRAALKPLERALRSATTLEVDAVVAMLRRRAPDRDSWTPQMCYSLVRSDPRFKIVSKRAVELRTPG